MNTLVVDRDSLVREVKTSNTILLKDLLQANPGVNPFADGWYVIEFSEKLRTDRLISKKFLGEDVVLYRDPASGEAIVVQAHCPHMGAHFDSYQNGGCVKDGVITCPYHLLKYDTQGLCLDAKKDYQRAHLKKYRTLEHNGFVLALYQQDDTDGVFSIDLDIPEVDPKEFVFITQTLGKFHGDAMVPLMANADMNHFFAVHGTKRLRPLKAFEVSNNGRDAHFSFEADMHSDVDPDYPRGGGFKWLRRTMARPKIKVGATPENTVVDTYCRGPGLVMSRWVQPYLKIEALTWLYATPITPNEYEIFMVQAVKTLRRFKSKTVQRVVNRLLVFVYARLMDLFVGHEDPPFYNDLKIRLAKPVFTKNDAHLAKYTAWWKGLAPQEFQALIAGKNIDFSR